mgnify:CR=1 FL=1
MAAPACWTCRSFVQMVMQVYGVVAEDDCCPICLQSSPQLCVAVPCGHHICVDCSQQWASRLATFVKVPGGPAAPGPAAAAAPATLVGGQTVPPPWSVAPPQVVPAVFAAAPVLPAQMAHPEPPTAEPAMPPPRVPALGEAFLFTGRLVSWVTLWRFGSNIVLVWADSGLLCKGGDHVVRPAGIPGWRVEWHDASERDNRKWMLHAEVYDV